MGPSNNFLSNLGLGLVIGVGAIMALKGMTTVGIIASFVTYSRQFSRPINQMSTLLNSIQAAKTASAHGFIKHLPDQYHTRITSGGANISQGQKQLLSIARAILANADILILDEATSNIDTRTEAAIQQGVRNLTEGKTSFVIAHRLKTIEQADCILVIKDGELIEQGTHDELLKQRGFYHGLYSNQLRI